MATTVSKAASGKRRSAASISCRPVTWSRAPVATRSRAFSSISGDRSMPTTSRCVLVVGQRQPGADADLEHAALARVDHLDGVPAPLAWRRGRRCSRRWAPSGDRRRARRSRRCGRCRRCAPARAPRAPAGAGARNATVFSFGYSLLSRRGPRAPKSAHSAQRQGSHRHSQPIVGVACSSARPGAPACVR